MEIDARLLYNKILHKHSPFRRGNLKQNKVKGQIRSISEANGAQEQQGLMQGCNDYNCVIEPTAAQAGSAAVR